MSPNSKGMLAAATMAALGLFGLSFGRSDQSCIPSSLPPPLPPPAPAPPTPVADSSSDGSPGAGGLTPEAGPEAGTDGATATGCESRSPRVGIRRRREERRYGVVGGSSVPEGVFPSTVAIATPDKRAYCGGNVIGSKYVLSAAHCQVDVGDLVLLGSVDLRKTRAIKVVASRIHAKFDAVTIDHDVAIAVLETDALVPAAPLATTETRPVVTTVVGWGATREGGSTTTLLQQVELPFWPWDDCRRTYPDLTVRQMCAGRREGGADSCQGDSGGPLLVQVGSTWRQIGIVSYGNGCARPGVPGVYTDVRNAEIRDWIDRCAR